LFICPAEVSREWTRVSVHGPGPVGRYGHAVTMAASKFIVFGGQVDGQFLNDVWSFDLNSRKTIIFTMLQHSYAVQSGQRQYGNFWSLQVQMYLRQEPAMFA
jgi:Galactose oxidase, central domain